MVVGGERGRLLVPPLRLAGQAPREAQLRQAQREPVSGCALGRLDHRPVQRGPKVIGDPVEGRPAPVLARIQGLRQGIRLGQAPAQVPGVGLGQLIRLGQTRGPVLANRLQHAVPGAAGPAMAASRL